jgi:hypothetical protein
MVLIPKVLYAIFPKCADNSEAQYSNNVSIPIAKIKRQEYLKAGRMTSEAAIGSSRDLKNLQHKVVEGTIDDYAMASMLQKHHVKQFREWLQSTQQRVDDMWLELSKCQSKKELAINIGNFWLKHHFFDCFSNKQQPNTISYLLSIRDKVKKTTVLSSYQESGGDLWFTKM